MVMSPEAGPKPEQEGNLKPSIIIHNAVLSENDQLITDPSTGMDYTVAGYVKEWGKSIGRTTTHPDSEPSSPIKAELFQASSPSRSESAYWVRLVENG